MYQQKADEGVIEMEIKSRAIHKHDKINSTQHAARYSTRLP